MKKKYSSFEEIKQDVENGIRVCWMNDSYFVSKLNDLYIIAIVSNPHYSGGKDDKIIAQQAKFLPNDIIGKISDKEELEEYLKIRLKEFLKIINKQ